MLHSVAFYHHGLVAACRNPVPEPDAAERRGSVSVDEQSQVAVFSVVDICKVLALDNFLHDVVGIDASVVHPGGVTLHRVLLPPGGPVWGQDGPRGSRRSLWTSSVLVALWRRVGGKTKAAGGAAARRGIPAMREVGQAGGAGVLSAVA